MSIINDIHALFLKIAETHPVIGHNPDGGVYRFYGYNLDEANSGDRNNLTFPRLGLALKTHAGLSGRIDNTGSSFRNNLTAEIVLLTDAKTNDYAAEQSAYDLMYGVMMEIIGWILWQAVTIGEQGPWPVIGLVDVQSVTFTRVGPIGTDRGFGWKLSILFKQMKEYSTIANPLNNMLP